MRVQVIFLVAVAAVQAAPAAAQAAPAVAQTAVASAQAAPAAGDRPAEAPGLRSQRSLDGHVFQPSLLARTPFAVKSFDVSLLYGVGDATGPRYDLLPPDQGTVRGERAYSFAAMGQTFAYEGVVAEGISVGGGLVTTLYSGTDSPSALVIGANIGAGLFGRATAGRRLGPVHAAATLDASYGPRLGIIVIDAVKDAFDDTVEESSALALEDVLTLQPGAAVAWAPHAALGLTASVDYQWLSFDQETGSDHASALGLGLAADVDLKPLYDVPLGLLAGVHVVEPLAGDELSRILDFSIGGFYTAKPELVLGAEIGWRDFEIRPDIEASGVILQVRSAYFW